MVEIGSHRKEKMKKLDRLLKKYEFIYRCSTRIRKDSPSSVGWR